MGKSGKGKKHLLLKHSLAGLISKKLKSHAREDVDSNGPISLLSSKSKSSSTVAAKKSKKAEKKKLAKQKKIGMGMKEAHEVESTAAAGVGSMMASVFGANVRPKVHITLGEYFSKHQIDHVTMHDIREFLLATLDCIQLPSPPWAFISHATLLKSVVVFCIDGMHPEDFIQATSVKQQLQDGEDNIMDHDDSLCSEDESESQARVPCSNAICPNIDIPESNVVPLRTNGSMHSSGVRWHSADGMRDLVGISKLRVNRSLKLAGSKLPSKLSEHKASSKVPAVAPWEDFKGVSEKVVAKAMDERAGELLVDKSFEEELSEHEDFKQWKRCNKFVPGAQVAIALDCEMVMTSAGRRLARVTAVNTHCKVLFDLFVIPNEPITDYCTKWSGITPEILKGVKTTLNDAQEQLLSLIDERTTIVGHSIENDLAVLKMFHNKISDTSLIYRHPKWRSGGKFALRHLSKTFLRKTIQASNSGHCSAEDASATMQLFLAKVVHGPTFGQAPTSSPSFLSTLNTFHRSVLFVDGLETQGFGFVDFAAAEIFRDASTENRLSHVRKALKRATPPQLILARLENFEGFAAHTSKPSTNLSIYQQVLRSTISKSLSACPPSTLAIFMTGRERGESVTRLIETGAPQSSVTAAAQLVTEGIIGMSVV